MCGKVSRFRRLWGVIVWDSRREELCPVGVSTFDMKLEKFERLEDALEFAEVMRESGKKAIVVQIVEPD